MRKFIILVLAGLFLTGCAYSTRVQVGDYGVSHTASVTSHNSL